MSERKDGVDVWRDIAATVIRNRQFSYLRNVSREEVRVIADDIVAMLSAETIARRTLDEKQIDEFTVVMDFCLSERGLIRLSHLYECAA